MQKTILKKLLLKNHNRINEAYKLLNSDLDDLIYELLKKQGLKFYKNTLSFAVNDVDFFGDIDQILLDNKIFNKKTIELVKQEFNQDRIDSSFEHVNDWRHSDFGASVDDFDEVLHYYEFDYRANKKVKKQLYEFDGDSYLTTVRLKQDFYDRLDYYYYNEFYNYRNESVKEYFKGGKTLQEAVKLQFDLLKEFYQHFNITKREFKKQLTTLWEAVKFHNDDAATAHRYQLEQDILDFIEENKLIIEGDIEKIKFDYIEKIENGQAITNKGAIVPVDEAKQVLKDFLSGVNIQNKKIGNYTILKIFDIKQTIFLRIGCHLIKIDNQLKQQLI